MTEDGYWEEIERAVGRGTFSILFGTLTRSLRKNLKKLRWAAMTEDDYHSPGSCDACAQPPDLSFYAEPQWSVRRWEDVRAEMFAVREWQIAAHEKYLRALMQIENPDDDDPDQNQIGVHDE